MLIVTQGLVQGPDGLSLHPVLASIRNDLRHYSRRWFDSPPQTPLSLAAWFADQPPAALLATRTALPEDVAQCWVASPFHAKLMRDRLQVMPEGIFPWAADDAQALVQALNPLLSEERMTLHAIGSALLLSCCTPMDAQPVSFAGIVGETLPNRHPEGADGGRIMRLVSEIQMLLYRNPLADRRQRGEPDISGLWLWGGCRMPLDVAQPLPPIATRNAFLASIADGKDAKWTITDAEQLDELHRSDDRLPDDILLLGQGVGLWLKRSRLGLFSWFRRSSLPLRPQKVKSEADLLQRLRRLS